MYTGYSALATKQFLRFNIKNLEHYGSRMEFTNI
jgi:hypothetical protein